MARSFSVSGDHAGQMSNGMRWPYGPVALITPFNFPLEIPALQLMGALYMGNKPLVHVDHRSACSRLRAPTPTNCFGTWAFRRSPFTVVVGSVERGDGMVWEGLGCSGAVWKAFAKG